MSSFMKHEVENKLTHYQHAANVQNFDESFASMVLNKQLNDGFLNNSTFPDNHV